MGPESFPLEEHFGSAEAQRRAGHVGMWVFLGAEVLLFAALFTGYGVYRSVYPEVFLAGREHMEVGLGTLNTFLLVTSSILVALAVWSVRRGHPLRASGLLLGAMLLGVAFLVVKGVEYAGHVREGALPGRAYALVDFARPGASLFFTLYWLTTGMHAVHVTVGVGVLGTLAVQSLTGSYSRHYHVPVELGGMYWHLVDVIWLFVYPLFYLV